MQLPHLPLICPHPLSLQMNLLEGMNFYFIGQGKDGNKRRL